MCTMYVSSIFKHLFNWNPSGPMETNETSKEVTGWLVNSQNSNRSLRKTWHFLGPGVGFVNDLWFFQKRRRIPQKNIWQKGDSPLWQRKLFVLVCVHLSKLKRRPNNSIVNLDLCFHLSSTVMSCHHAAPLVRQNPHGCFGRFSSGGWWSHPRTTKLGGSRTRETMGKTGDLGFH